MPTLKKMHIYRLRKGREKKSKYIDTVVPLEDREVPVEMFNDYEEVKGNEN